MDIYNNSNNILSVLYSFVLDNSDDIAMQIEHLFHEIEWVSGIKRTA